MPQTSPAPAGPARPRSARRWIRWRHHYDYALGYTEWPGRPDVQIAHLRVWKKQGGDGIGWDVLQQIKNDVIGRESVAIEIYPACSALIYECNVRHLWALPPGVEVPNLGGC